MKQFTPGPWEIDTENHEDGWPNIEAENYTVVGNEGMFGDLETDLANARLISMAPNMFKAIQDLLDEALDLYYLKLDPDEIICNALNILHYIKSGDVNYMPEK